jgi:hypothetical protein
MAEAGADRAGEVPPWGGEAAACDGACDPRGVTFGMICNWWRCIRNGTLPCDLNLSLTFQSSAGDDSGLLTMARGCHMARRLFPDDEGNLNTAILTFTIAQAGAAAVFLVMTVAGAFPEIGGPLVRGVSAARQEFGCVFAPISAPSQGAACGARVRGREAAAGATLR